MPAHTEADGLRDQLNKTGGLALWTLAWLATLAIAKFGPEFLWDSRPVSWIAVAVNLVVGVGWIVYFARFLRALDDLQRKILQDAMVITLGVAWVGGFTYVVADQAGLITYDVDVALFPALLGVVFMVASAVGNVRYR
jgi:hypothetical protein